MVINRYVAGETHAAAFLSVKILIGLETIDRAVQSLPPSACAKVLRACLPRQMHNTYSGTHLIMNEKKPIPDGTALEGGMFALLFPTPNPPPI